MDENKKEVEEVYEEPALVEESAGEAPAETAPEAAKPDLAQGIVTDNYDIPPELERHTEELAELEGRDCVKVEYTFNGDDIREGLKLYQKETLWKKNAIYSAILLVVFALYTVNIFRNPSEPLYYVLAALCLLVTAVLWIMPKRHIKKTAAAVETTEMRFRMAVYDDCLRIAEEGGGFVIHFGKEVTRVLDTPRHFLFCVGKERIFILPKRCLQEGQEEKLRTFVQNGMGEKYKRIPAAE